MPSRGLCFELSLPSNVRRSPAVAHDRTGGRRVQRHVGRPVALVYIMMYTCGMPRKYSIAEARSSLPHIVDQAEAGLEVELTRRGQPVAVVVSRREFDRLQGKRQHFGEAYRRFLEQFSLDQIGPDRDFAATRDKSPGRRVSL